MLFILQESWAITKIKEGVKVFYNKRRKQLLERETQNLFEDLQIGIGRYFPSIILALNKIQLSTLEKIQCNRRILEQNLQFVNKLLEDEITSNSLIKLITELNDMHLKNQLSELQTLVCDKYYFTHKGVYNSYFLPRFRLIVLVTTNMARSS